MSKRRVLRWVAVCLGGMVASVVPRAAAGQSEGSEELASGGTDGIVGGTTVPVCGWPSTVWLGNCSGTLIHPRVVTTAAHCSPRNGTKISFGEKSPYAFTITATKCVTSGMPGGPKDWAYCILPEDDRLKQVPILPPIHGCEKDKFLKIGTTVTAVGFGATSASQAGVGVKRQVDVKVTAVGNGTVDVDGNAQHGLCHGDSGGPIFIHLIDGANDYGWRAVGSTTGLVGPGGDCAGGTRFMSLDQHIAQIEKNEGIDVTPCTDATGAWAPGPDCKPVPTNPAMGGGMWPACAAGPLSGPIESCGPGGPGGGPDGGAGAGGSAGSGGAAGSGGGARGGAGGAAGAAGTSMGGGAGMGPSGGRGGASGGPGTAGQGGNGGSDGTTGGGTAGTGGASVGTDGGPGVGQGGAPGTGGSGRASSTGTGYESPTETSGCGCRVVSRTSGGAGALFALIGAVFAARRRKPRSRARLVGRSLGIAPLEFWPISAGQQIGDSLVRRLPLVEDPVDLGGDGHVDAELAPQVVGALGGANPLGDVTETGEDVGKRAPLPKLETYGAIARKLARTRQN